MIVHGAGGLLVAQFLDLGSNQRTDEWGGSPENRARFGLEVLEAMIEAFGHNVALKVNPSGGPNDMGYAYNSVNYSLFLLPLHFTCSGCRFETPSTPSLIS